MNDKLIRHVSKMLQILHGLLKSSTNMSETNIACIVPTVLKTLRKLTRSLRFRIYYYCEPCVANKKQKVMLNFIFSNSANCPLSDTGLKTLK